MFEVRYDVYLYSKLHSTRPRYVIRVRTGTGAGVEDQVWSSLGKASGGDPRQSGVCVFKSALEKRIRHDENDDGGLMKMMMMVTMLIMDG